MCAGSPGGGMRVTEARGKESVFNGASRGRRYGGRRIERRRPISRLRAATMVRRASLKKKVISPINRRALFCGVDHTTTMNTNSFARSEVFFVLFTLQILERASARLLHGSTFVVFVFSFRSLFEASLVVAVAPPPLQQVVLCDNTQRRGSFLF